MGKKIKLREAQRRAAEHALAARLREHSGPRKRPGFIESFSEFSADYRARVERYRDFALCPPEDWRCRLRVRAPEQRFLDLVRYTFAAYPVARHLENAWLVDPQAAAGWIGLPARDGEDAVDFRRWYIAAAQGRSLYGAATRRYMTRLETHHFVHAPADIGVTQRAFWYAFARAQTSDSAVALRVARTRLDRYSVDSKFWQDAARFFARNPTGVLEMNDLIDFIDAAWLADPAFTLAGRTLPALRERMAEWLRALSHIADGLRWIGAALPDVAYETAVEGGRAVWRFRQIVTDHALFEEGERMSHCVSTYRYDCAMGAASIWSLTCESPDGVIRSRVTVELLRDGTIAQCRGPCNRAPTAEEAAIVNRWAEEFGLTPQAYELQAA